MGINTQPRLWSSGRGSSWVGLRGVAHGAACPAAGCGLYLEPMSSEAIIIKGVLLPAQAIGRVIEAQDALVESAKMGVSPEQAGR